MSHIVAFILKFILIATIVLPTFTAFDTSTILGVTVASFLLAIIGYVIGDAYIYRKFGNVIASGVDMILAFGFLFLFGLIYNEGAAAAAIHALFATLIIVPGEAFFHYFIMNRVFGIDNKLDNRSFQSIRHFKTQAEASKEVFPYDAKNQGEENSNRDGTEKDQWP